LPGFASFDVSYGFSENSPSSSAHGRTPDSAMMTGFAGVGQAARRFRLIDQRSRNECSAFGN
jgi:hypothetical protein